MVHTLANVGCAAVAILLAVAVGLLELLGIAVMVAALLAAAALELAGDGLEAAARALWRARWWLVTAAAMLGTTLVCHGGADARAAGLSLWLATNAAMGARAARRRDWPLAALWAYYLATSAWGLWRTAL